MVKTLRYRQLLIETLLAVNLAITYGTNFLLQNIDQRKFEVLI